MRKFLGRKKNQDEGDDEGGEEKTGEGEENETEIVPMQRESWADDEFSARIEQERQRKSSLFMDSEWEELDVPVVKQPFGTPLTSFDEDGVDIYGNQEIYPRLEITSDLILSLAGVRERLHDVLDYLLPRDVVYLSMLSKELRVEMLHAPLRLDFLRSTVQQIDGSQVQVPRVIRLPDIEVIMRETTVGEVTGPKWTIKGVLVNISELPTLFRVIDINSIEHFALLSDKISSIALLNQSQSIKSLYLHQCEQLADISAVRGVRSLELLHLMRCPLIASLEPIRELPNMKDLLVFECAAIANIDAVRTLTNLESFGLHAGVNVQNFNALQGLEKLKSVEILNSPKLQSLACLRSSRELKVLDLSGCYFLTDISQLETVGHNLEALRLSGCEQITDIQALRNSTKLKNLLLDNLRLLQNISPLKRCTSLIQLRMKNCISAFGLHGIKKVMPNLQILALDACLSMTKKDAKAVTLMKKPVSVEVLLCAPDFLIPLLSNTNVVFRKAARVAIAYVCENATSSQDLVNQLIAPKIFALIDWKEPENALRDLLFEEIALIAEGSSKFADALVAVGLIAKLVKFLRNPDIDSDIEEKSKGAAVTIIQSVVANSTTGTQKVEELGGFEVLLDIAMSAKEVSSMSKASLAALGALAEGLRLQNSDGLSENTAKMMNGKGAFEWLMLFLKEDADDKTKLFALGIFVTSANSLEPEMRIQVYKTIMEESESYSRSPKNLSIHLLTRLLSTDTPTSNEDSEASALEPTVQSTQEALFKLLETIMSAPEDPMQNSLAAVLIAALPNSVYLDFAKSKMILLLFARIDSLATCVQQESNNLLGRSGEFMQAVALCISALDDVSRDMLVLVEIAAVAPSVSRVLPKALWIIGEQGSPAAKEVFRCGALIMHKLILLSEEYKASVQMVYKSSPIGIFLKLLAPEDEAGLTLLDELLDSRELAEKLRDTKTEDLEDFVQKFLTIISEGEYPAAVKTGATAVSKVLSVELPQDSTFMKLLVAPLANELKGWESDEFVAKPPEDEEQGPLGEIQRLQQLFNQLLNNLDFNVEVTGDLDPGGQNGGDEPRERTPEELAAEEAEKTEKRLEKVKIGSFFLGSLLSNEHSSMALGIIDDELLESLYLFLERTGQEQAKPGHEAVLVFFSEVLTRLSSPITTQFYSQGATAVVNELDGDQEEEKVEEIGPTENGGEGAGNENENELSPEERNLAERIRQMEESERSRQQNIIQQEAVRYVQRQRKLEQLEKLSASLRGKGNSSALSEEIAEDVKDKVDALLKTCLGEGGSGNARLNHILEVAVRMSLDFTEPEFGASALRFLKSLCELSQDFELALVGHNDFMENLEGYIDEIDQDYMTSFFTLISVLAKNHSTMVIGNVVEPLAEKILNGSEEEKVLAVAAVNNLLSGSHTEGLMTVVTETTIGESIINFLSTFPNRESDEVVVAAEITTRLVGGQASALVGLMKSATEDVSSKFVSLIKAPSKADEITSIVIIDMLKSIVDHSKEIAIEELSAILVKSGVLDILDEWEAKKTDSDDTIDSKTDAVLTVITMALFVKDLVNEVAEKMKSTGVEEKLVRLLLASPNARLARVLTSIDESYTTDSSEKFSQFFDAPLATALESEKKIGEEQAGDRDLNFSRIRGLPQEVTFDRKYNVDFGRTWTTLALTPSSNIEKPKLYFEVEVVDVGTAVRVGIVSSTFKDGILMGALEGAIGNDSDSLSLGNDGTLLPEGLDTSIAWKDEDIIGVAVDMEKGAVHFSINGHFVGQASFEPNGQVRPAVSGMEGVCTVNLGNRPFRFFPLSDEYLSFTSVLAPET